MLNILGIIPRSEDEIEVLVNKVSKLEFHQIYLVYKFLYTPLSVLESGFANMTKDQRKSYFKDVAVIIHPDKNPMQSAK